MTLGNSLPAPEPPPWEGALHPPEVLALVLCFVPKVRRFCCYLYASVAHTFACWLCRPRAYNPPIASNGDHWCLWPSQEVACRPKQFCRGKGKRPYLTI